jgi:sulfite reductase (ferredoxin)
MDEIRRFAREGFDSIPEEWLKTYFRWWGLYTQGDGVGVTGGQGGEGRSEPYFMLRIRVPGGGLFAHQVRTIADLAERHGRGVADITVRQNFQLHWVPVEALPEIFTALWRCGLTSMGACGDVTRNVTGCPLSGLDAGEVLDASPFVDRVSRFMVNNADFYNLPRKWKICITGCSDWCSYPEINDIALTGIRRDAGERGFSLRVGGGLSTEPHLAARLDAFVQPHQVLPVVKAVTEIFRDADCLRENRERARMKYLFLRYGWNAERFLDELHSRLGFRLDPAVEETVPAELYRDHVGVRPQRQPGLSYVGASVLRGRCTPAQLRAAADLAEEYGTGELRTTVMQNLVIPHVPTGRAGELAARLADAGLPVAGSSFHRGVIACTGTEFCKLAITETKGFARWLAREMDERLPGFDQPLKIHVTGCPNSCGQHWIADVGLEGKKTKVDGRMADAYYFFLGGGLGESAGFGRKTGFRCPAPDVPAALERFLRSYLQHRAPGESLQAFVRRHEEAELRTFLAGAPVAANAAGVPTRPTPAGVDG